MPINDEAILDLINASNAYNTTLNNPHNSDALKGTNPNKYSYTEMASLMRTNYPDYNPVNIEGEPLGDEQYVTSFIFDPDHPSRQKYRHLLDEDWANSELADIQPSLGYSMKKSFTKFISTTLAVVPPWVAGTMAATDKAKKSFMAWGELDYSSLGENIYNANIKGIYKNFKDAKKKYDFKYDEGKYSAIKSFDTKGVMTDVVKSGLDVMEQVLSKRASVIFDKQMRDPKFRAFMKYQDFISDPDRKWQDIGLKGTTAYLTEAVSSGLTTIGTGAAVALAGGGSPVAIARGIQAASTLAFVLEGSEQWKETYQHYKDLGYSDLMASQAAHLNATHYGSAAYALEKIPATAFLDDWSKKAIKSRLYNSIVEKSTKRLGERFTNAALKSTVNNKTVGFLVTKGVQGAAEGLEETLQFTAEKLIEFGYKGDEAFKDFRKEVRRAGGMGLTGGLTMGIGGTAVSYGAKSLGALKAGETVDETETAETKPSERINPSSPEAIIASALEPEGMSSDLQEASTQAAFDFEQPGILLNALKKGGSKALDNIGMTKDQVLTKISDIFGETDPTIQQKAANILGVKPQETEESKVDDPGIMMGPPDVDVSEPTQTGEQIDMDFDTQDPTDDAGIMMEPPPLDEAPAEFAWADKLSLPEVKEELDNMKMGNMALNKSDPESVIALEESARFEQYYNKRLQESPDEGGVSPDDLKANFQALSTGRSTPIKDAPEDFDKIYNKIKEDYPEVELMPLRKVYDIHGNEQAGVTIGKVSAWSQEGGDLTTVPHEVLHTLTEPLESDKKANKVLQAAYKESGGKEQFHDYAAEYYATNTIKGKSKGFISRFKTNLRKIWARVKKVFGKPSEYLAQEFANRGKFFAMEKTSPGAVGGQLGSNLPFIYDRDADKAKIKAMQIAGKTDIVNTKLKTFDIIDKKYGTKRWAGEININDDFARSIFKGIKSSEKKLIRNIIKAEGLVGKKIPIEDFKNIVMEYMYPVTIERGMKPNYVPDQEDFMWEEQEVRRENPGLNDRQILEIVHSNMQEVIAKQGLSEDPSRMYESLSAKGGENYVEYKIKVPFKVGKPHAEFADDNTFAWFRADQPTGDKTTLRINEIQSDLFQKNRSRETIVNLSSTRGLNTLERDEASREASKANEFLKGMRESDWHKYLTRSIIQWAGKEGYYKVQLPTGKTIEAIEGFDRIDEMIEFHQGQSNSFTRNINDLEAEIKATTDDTRELENELRSQKRMLKASQKELDHYTSAKGRTGPVKKFYNDLATFLRKTRKRNYEDITDSDGQTWIVTNITDEDVTGSVPLYQDLSPESKRFRQVEVMIDDAYKGMRTETGKSVPMTEFIKQMTDILPEEYYGVMASWQKKMKKITNPNIWKTMAQATEGDDTGYFTTIDEFAGAFVKEANEVIEGLDSMDFNDKHMSAKFGERIHDMFLSILDAPITDADYKKLMNSAAKSDYNTWIETDFPYWTKRRYKNLNGKQKQAVKRMWVQANSAAKINLGTMTPTRINLEYDADNNTVYIKGPKNRLTGETNDQRANKLLFEATEKDLKSKILWINKSDIYTNYADSFAEVEYAEKIDPMTAEEYKDLDRALSKQVFEGDGVQGMVLLGVRGDSGGAIAVAITNEHMNIAKDSKRLMAHWKKLVNAGDITKEQAWNLMGYEGVDGKPKGTETNVKWLAGEIARMEAYADLMPLSFTRNGSELLRRIKISTTPVFTSPMMKDFTVRVYDPENMIFVDNQGNEAPAMQYVLGMKGLKNRADGASMTSARFFAALKDAFGTDGNIGLAKSVIWTKDLKLAVKHQQHLPPSNLKMYNVDSKGNRILYAETDAEGNIKLANGNDVDILMTRDEAKVLGHDLDTEIKVEGNEFGLIKYHRHKDPKAKFPMQWMNYAVSPDTNNVFKSNILPKLDKWLNRMYNVSDSKENLPQLISKMIKLLKSDSPFAVSNALVDKSELGLGHHPDAEPMLNTLFKTRIIDPAVSLSYMKGAYLDVSPDWTGRLGEYDVSISDKDALPVRHAYASAKNIDKEVARDVPVSEINKWLKDNPVEVIVSRSPISGIHGIYVGRITELHNRQGQAILNTETGISRLEFDWDGDAVQIEFPDTAILEAVKAELKSAEEQGRTNAIDMSIYPSTAGQYQDLSNRDNIYNLANKFSAGSRAIGQIANAQSIYGQLLNIFDYAIVDNEYIRVSSLNQKRTFPEAKELDLTVEQIYRRWLQAAVDNGKFLLLDDCKYSSDRVFRSMFYRMDKNGVVKGAITDAQWQALKPMVQMHKIPNYIRNGGTPIKQYAYDTMLEASALYSEYVKNRKGLLLNENLDNKYYEGGLDYTPHLGKLSAIEFKGTTAPIEDVAIALAESWGAHEELGKENAIRFTDAVYKNAHFEAVDRLQKNNDINIQKALDQDGFSSYQEALPDLNNGLRYVASMWKAYTDLLQGFKEEIGAISWDKNESLAQFSDEWNAKYRELSEIGRVAATIQFLRQTSAIKDGEVINQRNRKVLPPFSKNEFRTLLHPSIMEEYLNNYNEFIQDEDMRVHNKNAFGSNQSFESIIKENCIG